jgi:hypothetical protein
VATILQVVMDLEEPRLRLIRAIPLGGSYRYLIAEGPQSLEVYIRAFVDTCATFPAHAVLLTADWGNHTEVLLAQRYSALPAFLGT